MKACELTWGTIDTAAAYRRGWRSLVEAYVPPRAPTGLSERVSENLILCSECVIITLPMSELFSNSFTRLIVRFINK